MKNILFFAIIGIFLVGCKQADKPGAQDEGALTSEEQVQKILNKYTEFTLTTDVQKLSDDQKKMISILIEAGEVMDELFWYETYGDREALLADIRDENLKKAIMINYGPWDKLNGNEPFVEGVGEKPLGANYYPVDMTKEEFENADIPDKTSLYTLIRRNDEGELVSVPYHVHFKEQVTFVSGKLKEAAALAKDEGLKNYLTLRAEAMLTDDYQKSDLAWLDMKDNMIDVVIGPIENYDDQLYGYKAAHEAFILIKDMEWSAKLEKFAKFLPELQSGLPVADEYKQEEPGRDTELNAYDVIYYAGDCNAGSKTIAINLPNDEEVQLQKGTRRLQLKNAMRAKFEKILLPIADVLIDDSQRDLINFDAFFANTMFHEVAHGLGIKNTINDKGTVRKALKEHFSALEEGKADMLGLYMVMQLHKKGEIEGDLHGYYTTFMAGIFRSVRFGSASAHGKANMIRFNYLKELGAFSKDEETGKYKVDFEKFEDAMNSLSELILTLQGDGNYEEVAKLVEEKANIGEELQADLDRLEQAGIPVDIVFNQGVEVLGL
jgi:hypothetical protein